MRAFFSDSDMRSSSGSLSMAPLSCSHRVAVKKFHEGVEQSPIMYVDVAVSRQHGKVYKRVLLRESYREKGQVKHRTISNLSKCSEEEIQAITLALRHKQDLCNIRSLKNAIQTTQGLSVGAILLLKTLADRLHLTKALGNSHE